MAPLIHHLIHGLHRDMDMVGLVEMERLVVVIKLVELGHRVS
jgi:hypothetical protein